MRNLLLIVLLVAVPAIAANKVWSAFQFVFDNSPVKDSLAVLKSINDPVFEEMAKVAPGFEAEYLNSFGNAFEQMVNATPAPEAVFARDINYDHDFFSDVLFGILKPNARSPYTGDQLAGALNMTVPVRFQDLKSKTDFSYRFCEFNPNDKMCLEGFGYGERYQGYLAYVLARRIISTPEFIDGMCSQAVPVLRWYLKWHEFSEGFFKSNWRKNLDQSFQQLDKALAEVYGDGTWNSSGYKPFDISRTQEFIFRRYLDGGPRTVLSMRNCLNQIRNEAGTPVSIAPNPNAADVFSTAVNFNEVGFINRPTHKIVVQTRRFTKETIAQITRLIENPKELKPVRDFSPYEYLRLADAVALTKWMSAADAKYDYRVITQDELDETFPNMADVCAVNRDYVLYGLKGLKLLPKEDKCQMTKLILVRVEK